MNFTLNSSRLLSKGINILNFIDAIFEQKSYTVNVCKAKTKKLENPEKNNIFFFFRWDSSV